MLATSELEMIQMHAMSVTFQLHLLNQLLTRLLIKNAIITSKNTLNNLHKYKK